MKPDAKSIYNSLAGEDLPTALPGFEKINRYWDTQHDIYAAKINPGEYYVSAHGELITTVLGSCIAVCVRDTALGIGGMNHFMLPVMATKSSQDWKDTPVSFETRYGNIAIERLINSIISLGGQRQRLECKIFGGAKVLDISSNVGLKNIEFAKRYIISEGFTIAAEDVGDIFPRKVLYFPASGRVRVKKLYKMHNDTLEKRDLTYLDRLSKTPLSGKVDLF